MLHVDVLVAYMHVYKIFFFSRSLFSQLLLYICGSKDKYRKLRDSYALMTHVTQVMLICKRVDDLKVSEVKPQSQVLPYDVLINLVSE